MGQCTVSGFIRPYGGPPRQSPDGPALAVSHIGLLLAMRDGIQCDSPHGDNAVWGWLQRRGQRPRAFARLRVSILCRRDVPIGSAWEAIGWWEARRIPFNLIVGSAGILSCIVVGVVGLGSYFLFDSEFGLPDPPLFALFGIIIYGAVANVCFTGGWLAELIVRKIWPGEADRFATSCFSLGLVFSVLLTLTPAIVIGAGGIFGLLGHLLGVVHNQGS